MEKKNLLVTTITLFFLASFGMAAIDSFIQNETTPYGIVSFEFIQSIEASNAAMEAWGSAGQIATGISLGLDFLYIVLYTVMMCIFLSMTAERVSPFSPSLEKVITCAAYAFPVVGVFDFIENHSLIQLLLGSQNSLWPATAFYCAIAKFGGSALALLLIIYGQIYAKFKAA